MILKKNEKDILPKDVNLNDGQHKQINTTHINRIQQRAQIAVLNQNGVDKHLISSFLDRDISTINKWTSRFDEAIELNDKKRPGHPVKFKEDVQFKAIYFYCKRTFGASWI